MKTISMKVTPEQLAAWREHAYAEYESLSEWIRAVCDEAVAKRKANRRRSGAERPAEASHVSTRQLPAERLSGGRTRPFRGMDAKNDPLRR